jgi:hypothetical protein
LAERVTVYRSDNLDGIPASEQWDLVVGNPPHFVDVSPGELGLEAAPAPEFTEAAATPGANRT